MTGTNMFELMDCIKDEYLADAKIKRKSPVLTAKEGGVSVFFKSAVSVAAILLVVGLVFVWMLVGKDLLSNPKGDEAVPSTITVPDGEGRYGYIDFCPGKYFVFVKYGDSTVKSVDFYDFDNNTHHLGIEFEYDSNRRITNARHYNYDSGYKLYKTEKAIIEYNKDGTFKKLHLCGANGTHRIGFEARDDGRIDFIDYDYLECILKLDENYLVTEIYATEADKEADVKCEYDEDARITSIEDEEIAWQFGYNDGKHLYSELICTTSDLISYTVERDDLDNIVYSKYRDSEDNLHEYSFRYTSDGIQLTVSQTVGISASRSNRVDFEYDENDKLVKTVAEYLGIISGDNIKNVLSTTIYGENRKTVKNTEVREFVKDGKVIQLETHIFEYDDVGVEKLTVESKFFDEDGNINRHELTVKVDKKGKIDKELVLKYLYSENVVIDGEEVLCTTQNEYNENYQLLKSTSSYYTALGKLFERVTCEYSGEEDQRLVKKTKEAFDDNGNVTNTKVENYDKNGNITSESIIDF